METYTKIFLSCCFLAIPFSFYFDNVTVVRTVNYRKFDPVSRLVTVANRTNSSETLEFDVKKRCDKICDRNMTTCFNPDSTIFIYEDTKVEDMTFSQSFSKVRSGGKYKPHSSPNMRKKRSRCPINDIDYSFDTLTMKGSCAIMGNAGILLKSRCGEEIDSHDFVMRANMAPVDGYSTDVGNKTSMMMINCQTTRDLHGSLIKPTGNARQEKLYAGFMNGIKFLNDSIIWYAKGLKSGSDSSLKLRDIAKFIRRRGLQTKFSFSYTSGAGLTKRKYDTSKLPSSGLIMLMAAQTFCKKITLYGFYPYPVTPDGDPVFHHYYDTEFKNFSTPVHNFDQEHKKLRKLHEHGDIRLVTGPCADNTESIPEVSGMLIRNNTESYVTMRNHTEPYGTIRNHTENDQGHTAI